MTEDSVRDTYNAIKGRVQERLAQFRRIIDERRRGDAFWEFVFCHFTPQTSARKAWAAASALRGALGQKGFSERRNQQRVAALLRDYGVRFHNNKAVFVIESAALFGQIWRDVLAAAQDESGRKIWRLRNDIAGRVKGIGLKEASHFLRNIGLGKGLAILDRHILRCLCAMGVICGLPKTLNKNAYHEIEEEMACLGRRLGVGLDELDLVFWYIEKGEIFK